MLHAFPPHFFPRCSIAAILLAVACRSDWSATRRVRWIFKSAADPSEGLGARPRRTKRNFLFDRGNDTHGKDAGRIKFRSVAHVIFASFGVRRRPYRSSTRPKSCRNEICSPDRTGSKPKAPTGAQHEGGKGRCGDAWSALEEIHSRMTRALSRSPGTRRRLVVLMGGSRDQSELARPSRRTNVWSLSLRQDGSVPATNDAAQPCDQCHPR